MTYQKRTASACPQRTIYPKIFSVSNPDRPGIGKTLFLGVKAFFLICCETLTSVSEAKTNSNPSWYP